MRKWNSDEGGMARQVHHSKSRSTAVLTANRADKSSKENSLVIKNLVRRSVVWDIDRKKVEGEYPEKDEKTGKKKMFNKAANAPGVKLKFKKQMKVLVKSITKML